MWVTVFCGCGGNETTSLECAFADHRTCAEANVTTLVVTSDAREIARVGCTTQPFAIEGARRDDALVIEALGARGTPLYRARTAATHARQRVTLRYVGGRDP